MEKILFKANGQSLVKTGGLSTYASDVVEFVEAEFTLGDEWLEYDSARAIWQNGDIRVPCALNHGKCTVPFEVLAKKGQVTVNLVASSADGDVLTKRITTYPIKAFTVTVKVNIDGTDPQTITPTQFEQFVEAVHDDADRAKTEADRSSSEADRAKSEGEAQVQLAKEEVQRATDEADRAEDEAEHALASAQAAEGSATRASNYANDAKDYADNASDSADASASSATASANSASASAQSASDSADSASASAESAREAEEAKQTILTMRAVARSLPEGSQATASYENGLLTLGIPKGDKGDTGNGIDHVQLNSDYTLTIFFTDGTQTQTTSIRGEKGETGAVPNFSIGEVTTLDEHEQATASIEGTAEEPILNLGIPQGKTGEVSYEDLSSLLPKDTASGDIISIPDGQSIIPVESLKVTLEPIQDLHGYDKPWSGGAGKNLYDKDATNTANGYEANFYISTNGNVAATQNYNVSEYIEVTPDTVYTIGKTTGSNPAVVFYDSNKEYISGIAYNSLTSVTFTTPSSARYMRLSIPKVNADTFQLELGSTATTYEPYSNICPIDGWTEVNTQRTGKNLFDLSSSEGFKSQYSGLTCTKTSRGFRVSTSASSRSAFLDFGVLFSGTYTISFDISDSSGTTKAMFLSKNGEAQSTAGTSSITFTADGDSSYGLMFYASNSVTYCDVVDIQLELGSTASDFESYDGKTIHTEIEGNYTVTSTDKVPYLQKEVGDIDGDRLREKIIGGTVNWNQLAKVVASTSPSGVTYTSNGDGSYTVNGTATTDAWLVVSDAAAIGHKYFIGISGNTNVQFAQLGFLATTTSSSKVISPTGTNPLGLKVASGTTASSEKVTPQIFDLTAMLGTTIADYIYSLEQANAGDGVAWFKKLFPNDYYAYDAGSLKSVQTSAHVTKDADGNVLGNYPLDSSKTLRGIFKLDANNNLYADGDIYYPSEGIDRRYSIVDLGTLNWIKGARNTADTGWTYYSYGVQDYIKGGAQLVSTLTVNPYYNTAWEALSLNEIRMSSLTGKALVACGTSEDVTAFKTAMQGVYLVYELATPTKEEAEPFAEIQKVISGGTEEYIDNREVPIPVGHETKYLSRETYGCTIDIVSGECVIDTMMFDNKMLSQLPWSRAPRVSQLGGYYYISYNFSPRPLAPISKQEGTVASFGTCINPYDHLTDCAWAFSNGTQTQLRIGFVNDPEIDGAIFTQWLAEHGEIQVAFKLESPTIIQLTPEEIHLLLGDNTIWSYGIIELAYSADVTKWLMKKLNS